uniref:DNA mismatch repair proteins mutS family domain-containing protein n=1 Tax=viral metagenome TaxID=1070528 RepID=A0A6C0CU53_9ZZZZ
MLRSKQFRKHLEKTELFFNQDLIPPYFYEYSEISPFTNSYISKSIWEDLSLTSYASQFTDYEISHQFIQYVLKHPIYDASILQERQFMWTYFQKHNQSQLLTPELEKDWYWLLSLESHTKNYIIDSLFPSSKLFRILYYHPYLLNAFQIYRSYCSPMVQCIYPISLILGPYVYVRTKMKWKLAFTNYLKIIYQTLRWLYCQAKDTTTILRNIAMLCIYIGIYIYSFFQIIDYSNQLRKYRNIILKRMQHIQSHIQRFQKQLKEMTVDFWKPYMPHLKRDDLLTEYKGTVYEFYTLWKYPQKRLNLKNMYEVMGIYETLRQMAPILHHDWTLPTYDKKHTYLGSMRHPLLPLAVANPIHLGHHLIVTGPNAAGKTTYVKALLWNILLGQSFGIVRAAYGNIHLYDTILHHDRIKDMIGNYSLFEAEMKKIHESLAQIDLSNNIIYFMDEPLHSTPPYDGAAMLKAWMLYLAQKNKCPSDIKDIQPNQREIKMILTTHYLTLQHLEEEAPKDFKNLSMIALRSMKDQHQFIFPYKIQKGFSNQTIGIELLKERDFPIELIETAIKIKNKIYSQQVNV